MEKLSACQRSSFKFRSSTLSLAWEGHIQCQGYEASPFHSYRGLHATFPNLVLVKACDRFPLLQKNSVRQSDLRMPQRSYRALYAIPRCPAAFSSQLKERVLAILCLQRSGANKWKTVTQILASAPRSKWHLGQINPFTHQPSVPHVNNGYDNATGFWEPGTLKINDVSCHPFHFLFPCRKPSYYPCYLVMYLLQTKEDSLWEEPAADQKERAPSISSIPRLQPQRIAPCLISLTAQVLNTGRKMGPKHVRWLSFTA